MVVDIWAGALGDWSYGKFNGLTYVWPVRSGQPGVIQVPQTGQTTSYRTGDDGDLQRGVAWPAQRFADNSNGVVTDNLTGLVWLKDANCINTNYSGFDNDSYSDGGVTWQHALDFVKGINNGTYSQCGAGYRDWRLPNRKALRSLIDYSRYNPALPAGHPFTNVQSLNTTAYWSSTTGNYMGYAWYVWMRNGGMYPSDDNYNESYVWPVRGGQVGGSFGDLILFPLRGYTPYTAPISSVFDHSMNVSYAEDGVVTAYTNERGDNQNFSASCDCYNKSDGTAFTVNSNYTGASTCGRANYLCYDGHPGTDYPVANNTPVYAADAGTAHLPASFPGISNAQSYNTVEIEHQSGYRTYYLHLSSRVVSEGTPVKRGDLIGYSGDVGSPGSYHLHFEVQRNGVPVDPYGWQGSGTDPYTRAANYDLWMTSPATLNHYDISSVPTQQSVNTPFSVTITAKDVNENTVNFNGYVTLSAPGSINPTRAPLASGTWSGNVSILGTGNNIQITASGGGAQGISNSFNVTGGQVGTTGRLEGEVYDNLGNKLGGATVRLSKTENGADAYPPDETSSWGRYVFDKIESGTYYIWAEYEGKNSDKTVTYYVPSGQTTKKPLTIDIYNSNDVPVVLVPGMMGSTHYTMAGKWFGAEYPYLTESYEKPDELILHNPNDKPGWETLKNELKKNSIKKIIDCPWDWRVPLEKAVGQYLKPCIKKAQNGDSNLKVNVVAHSMGGLLTRAYIQGMGDNTPYGDDILNFMMAGTPNKGSSNAYYILGRRGSQEGR
jgi:murein DD-endopeptidase MepM/ murein hydrolase activator NlpD